MLYQLSYYRIPLCRAAKWRLNMFSFYEMVPLMTSVTLSPSSVS